MLQRLAMMGIALGAAGRAGSCHANQRDRRDPAGSGWQRRVEFPGPQTAHPLFSDRSAIA